jgi:hypothetical protein
VSLLGHLHDGTVEFEPLALPDPPFDRNAAVVGSVLEVNGWSSHTWSRRGNGWLVQFDRADGSGP